MASIEQEIEKALKKLGFGPQIHARQEKVAAAVSVSAHRAPLAAERLRLKNWIPGAHQAALEELDGLNGERAGAIRGLAPRYAAVRARLDAVEAARRRVARIERELLDIGHPALADAGPLVESIGSAIGHVQGHCLAWADRAMVTRRQQELAETKRGLAPGFELKSEVEDALDTASRRLELADAAEELLPTLEAARKSAIEMQLAAEPDLAATRELVKGLPARCSCGHAFAFHDPEAA